MRAFQSFLKHPTASPWGGKVKLHWPWTLSLDKRQLYVGRGETGQMRTGITQADSTKMEGGGNPLGRGLQTHHLTEHSKNTRCIPSLKKPGTVIPNLPLSPDEESHPSHSYSNPMVAKAWREHDYAGGKFGEMLFLNHKSGKKWMHCTVQKWHRIAVLHS